MIVTRHVNDVLRFVSKISADFDQRNAIFDSVLLYFEGRRGNCVMTYARKRYLYLCTIVQCNH